MMEIGRQKKRILWVTYDFPPRQSSGMLRPIKIYKYLNKERFEVEFLTQAVMPQLESTVQVERVLKEVQPRPVVYRRPNWIFDDLLRALTGRRGSRSPRQASSPKLSASAALEAATDRRPRRTALKAAYETLIMRLYFPDPVFVWGWLAAITATWLHLNNRYDAIYTTSYPESAHLSGLALKKLGLKWVADYRYAGVFWNKEMLGYRKTAARDRRELSYQRRVVHAADLVIVQGETIKQLFCEQFGLAPAKLKVIPSGFDEEDFLGFGSLTSPFEKRPGETHVLHVGAWYLNRREATRLIEELNGLKAESPGGIGEIVLHAVGADLFDEEQKRQSIQFCYVYHGVVSHDDIIPYLAGTDCYLVSTLATLDGGAPVHGYLPGKMWEYLRGGKPILYVGPEDEAWGFAKESGLGLYLGLLDGRRRVSAEDLLDALQRAQRRSPEVDRHSWRSRAAAVEEALNLTLQDPERDSWQASHL